MKLALFALIAVMVVSGCASENTDAGDSTIRETGEEDAVQEPVVNNTANQSESVQQSRQSFSEEGLTKFANNYYRYDPGAFDAAAADGKVIFLDFHADWCPICNSERPGILDAFNEISHEDVVGFQVHYNDGQTQDFDTDAARKYQVAYQHTKVIINREGRVVLKSLEVLGKGRIISEIEAAR